MRKLIRSRNKVAFRLPLSATAPDSDANKEIYKTKIKEGYGSSKVRSVEILSVTVLAGRRRRLLDNGATVDVEYEVTFEQTPVPYGDGTSETVSVDTVYPSACSCKNLKDKWEANVCCDSPTKPLGEQSNQCGADTCGQVKYVWLDKGCCDRSHPDWTSTAVEW